MVVNRITITLEQSEYNALLEAAIKELRSPSDQARFIVREHLVQGGLLINQSKHNKDKPNQEVKSDK